VKKLLRLEKTALACFVFWLAAGVIITPLRLGPETVQTWALPGALRGFIILCLRWGDPILILLAAFNTGLMSRRYLDIRRAAIWAVIVMSIGAVVETTGTLTDFPFGAYSYTSNFGPLIGGVLPAAIPLAWYVVITQILFAVRILKPGWNRFRQAVTVATAAALLDGIMEPFAVWIKGYWTWRHHSVPCQNYVAWWVVSFLIVQCFAPTFKIEGKSEIRPLLIVGGIIFLFVEARLVYVV
jgi:uncharacterized membrane protein